MGLLHCLLAHSNKAHPLLLVEMAERRRASALEFPFDLIVDPEREDLVTEVRKLTCGEGADVVLVTAPATDAQKQAIDLARRGGYIDFFAGLPPPWQPLPLDSQKLHYEELTIRGSHGAPPHLITKRPWLFLERGQVPATDLITHRFPLSRIAQAFACVRDGEGLKVIVEPDLEDPVSNPR